MADYEALSDEQILSTAERFISSAVGDMNSAMEAERLDVLDYYKAEKPRKSTRGKSGYVSSDVYDSIEQMKAQLLETFSSGHRIVKFAPVGPEDAEPSRIATEVCDWVVHRQNSAFDVFHDVIHDGLVGRIGVVKVWWDQQVDEITSKLPPVPEMALFAWMAQQPEGTSFDLEKGTVTRVVDRSQVRVTPLPPEQFLIDPMAKLTELERANCGHRRPMSRSSLMKMGYDVDDVRSTGGSKRSFFVYDTEARSRLPDDIGLMGGDAREFQRQTEEIDVYELYLELDVEGTGLADYWRILCVEGKVLDKEKVRRNPFVVFCPLRISHTIWGNNYGARMVSAQKAKTVVVRGILDHTVQTNTPRWQVVNGTLKSPKELMDPRLGGLINVSRPDGILPLPQQALNPFVFPLLNWLDYDQEDTSGISRLSQGLNKDAVSKQNSQAMVEQLTDNSQVRQKIIARNFARFLKDLYLLVYELVLENVDRGLIIEVAGNWVPVDTTDWQSRKDVSVELHLGYGEQDREAEKWFMMDQFFEANPRTQQLYGLDRKYNLLSRAWALKGVKNFEDYLTPPDQAQPPQPDPVEMAKLQVEAKRAAIEERRLALEEMKVRADIEERMTKLRIEEFKATSDHALKSDEMDLKEREFEHEKTVDMAEVEIMRKESDNKSVIVSPNS